MIQSNLNQETSVPLKKLSVHSPLVNIKIINKQFGEIFGLPTKNTKGIYMRL